MQCKFEIPQVKGLDDGVITVGRELLLHCSDFPTNFNIEKTAIKSEDALYNFRILNIERRDLTSADIKWTSYRAGKHSFPQLVITDSTQDVDLGPLTYEVQSVLSQTEPRKEPFGPIGPLSLPIPVSVWMMIVFVIVSLVVALTISIRRMRLRKQWQKDRQKYQVRISPVMQLYVDLRRLDRRGDLTKADHAGVLLQFFEEYFIRKFDWPVPLLRRKQIVQKIKSELKADKSLAKQLTELYRSLYAMTKNEHLRESADLPQLQKDLLILIERLEKEKRHELA